MKISIFEFSSAFEMQCVMKNFEFSIHVNQEKFLTTISIFVKFT